MRKNRDHLTLEDPGAESKKAASTRALLGEPSEYLKEPYWMYIKRNEAPKHLYIVRDPNYDCNLLYDPLIHKN